MEGEVEERFNLNLWIGGFIIVAWISSSFLWVPVNQRWFYWLCGFLGGLGVYLVHLGCRREIGVKGKIFFSVSGGLYSLLTTLSIYYWTWTGLISAVSLGLGVHLLVKELWK